MSKIFCSACVLLISLLWLGNPFLQADNGTDAYTTHTVGDTVFTYGEDNRYAARLYAFIDADSCGTCIQDLSNIAHVLSAKKDVQIVLFVQSQKEFATEQFRTKYNWNFPLVHDVATAYRKLYNITRSPLCLLTDGAGVITFIGIPGTSTFTPQAIEATLERAKKVRPFAESLTRLQKNVVVYADGTPVRNWITQFGTHMRGKDEFVLWNFFTKELLWIDGQGKILKSVSLTEFPENHGSTIPRPIFFAGEAAPDRIPFLNLNAVDMTATMYNVRFDTDTLERLWDIPLPDSVHNSATTAFRLSDTSFLLGALYSDRAVLEENPHVPTATIVNSAGEITGTLGKYETYNKSLYIMNYFMQSFCLDDRGNIYMTESLSDTIRVYNPAGELFRSIACEYDSTLWHYGWRDDFMVLDEESPLEDVMKPSDTITKVAGVNGLFYDTVEQEVYVVYQRKTVTRAGNTSYRFFVHRPGRGGKAIRRDLALPGDAKPIYVSNGRLYCTETIDGAMNLTVYALPDWL